MKFVKTITMLMTFCVMAFGSDARVAALGGNAAFWPEDDANVSLFPATVNNLDLIQVSGAGNENGSATVVWGEGTTWGFNFSGVGDSPGNDWFNLMWGNGTYGAIFNFGMSSSDGDGLAFDAADGDGLDPVTTMDLGFNFGMNMDFGEIGVSFASGSEDNGDGSENNRLIWENGILPTGSTTYTQSCFIKSNQNNLFQLSFRGNSTNVTSAVFNLDTGVVAHTYNSGDNTLGQTSIHALDNGWFRCRLTATLGTLGDGRISIGPVDEIGNLSVNGYARYVGNGNTGCDIWGLMVSEGANLRKYIKTTSSASSTIETGELSKTYYDGQI